MPRFSVCINAYNAEKHLGKAIESVLSQNFSDYELIVLDDASQDNTAGVISEYEKKSSQVKGIFKQGNEGLYLGRKDIIDACCGDYVVFLDADDEMQQGLLEQLDKKLILNDVDMFHYGISVKGFGVDEDACKAFEDYVNKPVKNLCGDELIDSIFGGGGEYVQDWRLCQRAFKTEVLKRANKIMTNKRLDCAEDAYQMFVFTMLCESEATNNDIKGLVYNFGLGLNGQSEWSVEKFVQVAKPFRDCMNEIEAFANEFKSDVLIRNAETGKLQLLDLLFNDWHQRVADKNKLRALELCEGVFTHEEIACQVARIVRDSAFKATLNRKTIAECENIVEWFDYAKNLMQDQKQTSAWRDYYSFAKKHVDYLCELQKLENCKTQCDLRIFVSCHKEVDLFDSKILQPVQVGSKNAHWRFPWALQDDEGDNISELNPTYCELTAQYWAWKNVDCERYGFCHYRRYFNFSDEEFEENEFGEIIDLRINKKTQEKFGLLDENIISEVKDFDIVTTKFQNLSDFPGDFKTPRQHWHDAENLFDEDLDLMVEILKEMHPDYSSACEAYLNGSETCFCNMFVMKKEIFHHYSSWLFGILEEFCRRRDMTNYSKEALRCAGHLAERLLNIYILKHKTDGSNWKHKQVQCVHFEKPDRVYLPLATFHPSQSRKKTIPIVMAAGNNYVHVMMTALYSLVVNASLDYRLDVVILHKNISYGCQQVMFDFFKKYKNVSLRFVDVGPRVENFALVATGGHIGTETYYRFLIQDVVSEYEKVIYLDCDIIVEGDVSQLYETDLCGKVLAAVSDIDFVGNLNIDEAQRIEYNRDVLGLADPYAYFQAGVLLLDVKKLRELHSTLEWLELTKNDNLKFDDQDILNMECEGKVAYLPMEWNVVHNCEGRLEKIIMHAPARDIDNYFKARENAKIIHYAGFQKPWIYCDVDMEEHFWKYARHTPFYQKLLDIRAKEQIDYKGWQITGEIERASEQCEMRCEAKVIQRCAEVVKDALNDRIERHQRLYHPFLHVASKAVRKVRRLRKM